MDSLPQSGKECGQHGAASGAGVAQAAPALSSSRPEKVVGLFIPSRLAARLAEDVAIRLHRYAEIAPLSDVEYLRKEAVLELQKALRRAGYAVPA